MVVFFALKQRRNVAKVSQTLWKCAFRSSHDSAWVSWLLRVPSAMERNFTPHVHDTYMVVFFALIPRRNVAKGHKLSGSVPLGHPTIPRGSVGS